MKPFPEEKLNSLLSEIDKCLEDSSTNPIAAFDADGTLWDTDIGDIFFDYQIENKLVDLPENAWEFYLNIKNQSPETGYLWLAQINKGKSIEQVRQWAKKAIDAAKPIPVFDVQKTIIDHLHKRNVEVYIVTASIKWSVEPAAELYNIPFEKVIGVQTAIEEGIVTDIQKGAITYKEGKVAGLLENTNEKRAFFCAGNTMGDFPLLESATHLRLVMTAASKDHHNYKTEQELLKIAQERQWYFHNFV